MAANLGLANPVRNKNTGRRVELLQEGAYGSLGSPLLILQGAVGFVLLIGCANVAGLLLARAASRRTEIAVRTAIGAGRRRIVFRLITESVPPSLLGGLLGIVFAWGGRRLFVAYAPQGFLPLKHFTMDATVLVLTTWSLSSRRLSSASCPRCRLRRSTWPARSRNPAVEAAMRPRASTSAALW